MIDLKTLTEADLHAESTAADEAARHAAERVRQIGNEFRRRLRVKQDACPHTGWRTSHVCCPLCGAEDGC